MGIFFDEAVRVFRLDTPRTSYAMIVEEDGSLGQLYYGARIRDLAGAAVLDQPQMTSFSPYPDGGVPERSRNFMPQEFATHHAGDFRISAAAVRTADGTDTTDARYVRHRIFAGKSPLDGLPATYADGATAVETLEITLRDDWAGVAYILSYSVFDNCDAIARSVRVVNTSDRPVTVERLMSVCCDLPGPDFDLITLDGAWARERHRHRTPLRYGLQGVASTRTSSSHHHNPAFALAEREATERYGEVYGFCLVYSGSFLGEVELDAYDRFRVCLGIHPDGFTWKLEPGESFQAPEALLVFSASGLGGMSREFHTAIRENLCPPSWKRVRRPILINNWEATYFNFDADKLIALADDAAKLGIEMLVLDDGWFGRRQNDRSSLGDWTVNREKIGDLGELSEAIHRRGLKFGLWFEPEMISYDSELYRKHPDWVLTVPGRNRSQARHQMVLNMADPEIVDYLFKAVSAVLRSARIEYIKWDMNRQPAEMSWNKLPADRQQEVGHRYVLGVYELHRRLLAAFPDLLIEGCSGGGGRFDAGLLAYAPQIWTSDDTDAFERIKIQFGTSLFYPASAMSAHVSICPNHQTGRTAPFKMRGDVALLGAFGYELDLSVLNDGERALVREQIANFHRHSGLIAHGVFHRLSDPFAPHDWSAWEFAAADGSEALLVYVVEHQYPDMPPVRLRLRGLDAARRYRVGDDGPELYGDTLMHAGLPMPASRKDGESHLFHLTVC